MGQLKDRSVAICPQSGHVYLTAKDQVSALTQSGFIAHPAKTVRSLNLPEPLPVSLTQVPQVPEDIETLMLNLHLAKNVQDAIERLQALKQHSWIQDLRKELEQLKQRLKKLPVKSQEAEKILEAAQQFEQQMDATFAEAEKTLQQGGRLRALLQFKDLETQLCEPAGGEGINQFSVASMMAALKAGQEIADYQAKLGNQKARFADILLEGQRTPDADVYPLWKDFLLKLEKLPEQQTAAFYQMIRSLKTADEMASWMTFFFKENYPDSKSNPSEALGAFKAHFPELDRASVATMTNQLQQVAQLKHQLNNFAEREKFEVSFQRLQDLGKQLTGAQLKAPGGVVLTQVRLKLMNEFVDLYDSAIKTMKVSSQWTDAEKAKLFKKMLEPYVSLADDWAQNLGGNQMMSDIDPYLSMIRTGFSKIQADANQLRASNGFNVASAKIGAVIFAWEFRERRFPETLEDHFTLAHQNLLAVMAYQNIENSALKNMGSSENLRPLSETMEAISKLKVGVMEEFSPILIGTKVTENLIAIQYKIPLRSHAAGIELTYHKQTGKLTFKVDFFGGNERERWDRISFLMRQLEAAKKIQLTGPIKSNALGMEFSCEIKAGSINQLIEEFKYATETTFWWSDSDIAQRIADASMSINSEEVFGRANQLCNSNIGLEKMLGFHLLGKLFEKNQHVQEATEMVEKLIVDSDKEKRILAIEISVKLAERDKPIPETVIKAVAKMWIRSYNDDIKYASLGLFAQLAKNNHPIPVDIIESALHRTQSLIYSPYFNSYKSSEIRELSLKLIENLFQNGLGFKEASKILDPIKSWDSHKKAQYKDLQELFSKYEHKNPLKSKT